MLNVKCYFYLQNFMLHITILSKPDNVSVGTGVSLGIGGRDFPFRGACKRVKPIYLLNNVLAYW